MGPSGEQPPELPPQPVGESVHLAAHAHGQARVNQAGRDLHLIYPDGVRRVESDATVQECPYPGLAAFGREHARWFFGRDQLTAELIARLDERLRAGGVQVVVAPSGAGKSSLLHAGLLPKLKSGALPGSSRWPTIVFTPTADPLAALATHIAALIDADPASLAEELAADSHRAGAVLRDYIGGEDSAARVVVVVDQFEELFTLCTDDQQRRTFIKLLSQLASPQSGSKADVQPLGLVVVGVRADFYAACANDSDLRTALQNNQLVVGPMSDTQLREAILYPARSVGLDVEAGLVELLLWDLGDTATPGESGITSYEAGRLPLLAHVLRVTWQQRHGHTLTVDGYRSTGGIRRAVATTADRVCASLDPAGQLVARTLFLRLIKIGDGTEDIRRRVSHTDLLRGLDPDSALPVLDAFTRGRLLTQEQDTVEITHEALVRAWPRLRQWIDTDRAGNLTRQELDDAAAAWDRDRRDNAGLYRGSRLEAALTWATSNAHENNLSEATSAFLVASTAQHHRATRVRRTVLVLLVVLLVLAAAAIGIGISRQHTVAEQRIDALSRMVADEADRAGGSDPSLAMQLSLAAYRIAPTPEARGSLLRASTLHAATRVLGDAGAVNAVAISPDGDILAAGSADQVVRLYDISNPQGPAVVTSLTDHIGAITGVAFSPDGHILASGSRDNTVRLWDLADLHHPTLLAVLTDQAMPGTTAITVNAVAFSPNGHMLASASSDHRVWLWDISNLHHPTTSATLTGHNSSVNTVAFSPDGRTLASGSDDRTVRLWDLADPHHPTTSATLAGHTDDVYAVAFSPDGHTLASGSRDRTVRLWDLIDTHQPTPAATLTGQTVAVESVAFSPDGHTLASGSFDSMVRLWDLTDPRHPTASTSLTGHTNSVGTVAFNPNRHTLATGSGDGTVRLWNLTDSRELPVILTASLNNPLKTDNPFDTVALSPNGHTLASAGNDDIVRLWDLTDPRHPALSASLPGFNRFIETVAFSPDGRILAIADGDDTIRLWDLTDLHHPAPPTILTGHTSVVESVTFSPDGHTLASASSDDTIRLWDLTDPRRPTESATLTGHTSVVEWVTFSPDGHTLASASDDDTIRLWDVTDPHHPTTLAILTGNTDSIEMVAISPNGRTLASGSQDGTVRLWDLTDLHHPTASATLSGHTARVEAVAFSPDGHTLASGSFDGTVRLWDLNDPHHLAVILTGHTKEVEAVAFTPDGHTLASGGGDGAIRLWDTDPEQTAKDICALIVTPLTTAQWQQYIPDQPYNPPCRSK